MAMYDTLPKDTVMLLSFVNTQLRDTYESLADFAIAFQVDADAVAAKLQSIDYIYDASLNQFV
jgi:hypothetical protein